jgi:hypothetical protein
MKNRYLLIFFLIFLITAATLTTGCLDTDKSGYGIAAGVIIGGTIAIHQLTRDSDNNAHTPEPPSDAEPVKILELLSTSLKQRDISGALKSISSDAQDKYREIFTKLELSLPLIADEIINSKKEVSYIGEIYAEISIVRQESEGNIFYSIVLLKGIDGNWRIQSL